MNPHLVLMLHHQQVNEETVLKRVGFLECRKVQDKSKPIHFFYIYIFNISFFFQNNIIEFVLEFN